MNNDEILNIPQPEPAWDYYEIWLELQNQRKKIDQALNFLAVQEHADESTDLKLFELIKPVVETLEAIADELVEYSEEVDA